MAGVHVGVSQDVEHLVPRFLDALMVRRVHHEDQRVGVDKVVAPERTQLGLATDVPVGEGRGRVTGSRQYYVCQTCGK